MDLRKLKTLIDLVSESNISELEITEAEGKVRIVKGGSAGTAAAPLIYAPAPSPVVAAHRCRGHGRAGRRDRSRKPGGPGRQGHQVADGRYLLPLSQPRRQAFRRIGRQHQPGQPVCIIEAMKIMNEIEADCEGKVVRLLCDNGEVCDNGEAVEFGQPLFVVE